MPFQVSPGVVVTETDLTGSVQAVSLTSGAIAGVFRWGPINKVQTVGSEAELVAQYGRPSNLNPETFFTAASFLAYSNALLVSRCANTTDPVIGTLSAVANTGAISNVVAQTVLNSDDYLTKTFDPNVLYVARFPGAMGNSLKISICDSAAAFSANLSTVPNANIAPSSNIAINPGSNVALISIGFTGGGTIANANTVANSLKSSLSVTDVLTFGNSAIGYQKIKISAIGAVTTNATVASFAVSLQDTFKLVAAYSSPTIQRTWEYYTAVDLPPGQSPYVAASGNTAAQDELHVVVVDEDGLFTGNPGTILETYAHVSRATDAKSPEGASIYYKNLINNNSKYVRWANDSSPSNTALNVVSSTFAAPQVFSFSAGQDGYDEYTTAASDVARAFGLLNDDQYQFGLVLTGPGNATIQNYVIDNVTSIRKDCVVYVSPPKSAVVANFGNEVTSIQTWANSLRSSKYSFRDSGYKYMYDVYNDVYRWIPLNGDTAGLTAQTDDTNDAWWSPAGYNRGYIKNVVKLAFNPSRKVDRDTLYRNGVNSVVTFVPEGTILFGDRTGLMTNSAFTSLPITRLFIALEKSIATAAKYSLFEFNDSFTQANFRNMVNPYLRDIQGRRGIKKYGVVCDGTNNTESVVARGEFVADIYIFPNYPASKITLNFVAVDKTVSFTEKTAAS